MSSSSAVVVDLAAKIPLKMARHPAAGADGDVEEEEEEIFSDDMGQGIRTNG